jgi:hypothetical protein
MSIYLKRDTKVFLKKGTAIWEIPVMSGFNFSQGNTTSEVVLKEMATAAGVSRRGRRVFNDALAPAEWSFSTYIRPFRPTVQTSIAATAMVANTGYKILSAGDTVWATYGAPLGTAGTYFVANGPGTGTGTVLPASIADAAANHHAVEEVLWAQFVGLGTYTPTTFTFLNFEAPNSTDLDIQFTGGNNISLGEFDLFFILGATYDNDRDYDDVASDDVVVYKIANCIINQANVNFDVDGIAMIEWSGMGTVISREADFDARTAITQGVTATNNFIRNKLTSLTVLAANTTAYPGAANNTAPGTAGSYTITLTGGSMSFSNNAMFLTPETLGVVNRPIGHIAGNKAITGNFTAYIEEDAALKDTSGQLLADALADLTTVTNSFALTFILGGTGNLPRFHINLPTAHLEIPKVQSDDIISVDIAFHGLPSTIAGTNEATLKYVGASL